MRRSISIRDWLIITGGLIVIVGLVITIYLLKNTSEQAANDELVDENNNFEEPDNIEPPNVNEEVEQENTAEEIPEGMYVNPVFEPVFADPSIIRADNGYFYAYATEDDWGDGTGGKVVPIIRSSNLVDWEYTGNAFDVKPNWKEGWIWAPEVKQFNGKYYMYYTKSTWGDPDPGIGVAIADSPEGPFEDQGALFYSSDVGVYAIDPMLFVEDGVPYLFFGGITSGIFAVPLSEDGLSLAGDVIEVIAKGYEAPYIIERNGYYYFFGSAGSCCNGANSSYRVDIGRAESLLGPYYNKEGQDMKFSPGTVLLFGDIPPKEGEGNIVGPGHNSIITDDAGNDWLVYHAINADKPLLPGGATRRPLFIDKIEWIDDWPVIEDALPSSNPKEAPYVKEPLALSLGNPIAELEQLELLPFLKNDRLAGGSSSYDRSGGNADGFDQGNFLYVDRHGDKVMLDLEGPGTVYRMWFTGFDELNSYIKIYFDGEQEPSIHMKLHDLFMGDIEPFLTPLVYNKFQSSGGFVSYVPLSFKESIKITTNGIGPHNFYNINYQLYPENAHIKTWDGTESLQKLRTDWNNLWRNGELSELKSEYAVEEGTFTLKENSTHIITELNGPRIIQRLLLHIPNIYPGASVEHILQQVRIQTFWDNEEQPSIDAPIGSFFGMGQFEVFPTRSLYAGMLNDHTLYFNIPMPFQHEAKIVLVNNSNEVIEDISFTIFHNEFSESFDNVGYLKTQFRHQKAEAFDNQDLLILEEEGSGLFVGVVQSVQAELYQGMVDRWHLEGDERIYVDDNLSPIIQGTGTEDFYNGGWYFGHGKFTTPLAGYTAVRVKDNVESSSYYRFLLGDAIPFRKNIHVFIEHGAVNDITEDAWLLAFYYHQPKIRMELTDELDVGNLESEEEHQYMIEEETWQGVIENTFEGVNNQEIITDDGRAHKGFSQFVMKIDPENEGVILRRRFDQLIGNQKANVFVDNQFVGTWYKAGKNIHHTWREEDIFIPAEFTKGKEEISIKIVFLASDDDWSEFYYKVYSLK